MTSLINRGLRQLLTTWLGVLAASVLFGLLLAVFQSAGDDQLAAVVRGILWVLVPFAGLLLAGLVSCLTLLEIERAGGWNATTTPRIDISSDREATCPETQAPISPNSVAPARHA